MAAFACLIFAFAGSASTLGNEHDARVIGLIAAIFQSWGLAFVFAVRLCATRAMRHAVSPLPTTPVSLSLAFAFAQGFVTGLSASSTVNARKAVAEAMVETPSVERPIFSA